MQDVNSKNIFSPKLILSIKKGVFTLLQQKNFTGFLKLIAYKLIETL